MQLQMNGKTPPVKYQFTKFSSKTEKTGKPYETSWEELKSRAFIESQEKDGVGSFYGLCEGNTRAEGNYKTNSILVYDIDASPDNEAVPLQEALREYDYIIESTHSHDPKNNNNCFRVLIRTTEEMVSTDYETVSTNFVEKIPYLKSLLTKHNNKPPKVDKRTGEEIYTSVLDKSCFQPSRWFYHPSYHPDREETYIRYMNEDGGMPLIPDTQKRAVENISSSNQLTKQSISELLKGSVEGTRHNDCIRISGMLFNKGMSLQDVIQLMLGWNKLCIPPRVDKEVIDEVENIHSKYHPDNPFSSEELVTTNEEFYRPCFTIDELQNEPEVEWMVEDLIMARSQCAIYGASGSTKSFLALDMGMHLALGKDWFNYKVYKPVPVLYVACEGGGGFINRINGWIKSHKLQKPKYFLVDKSVIYPDDKKSIENFIGFYKQKGFRDGMIFIDTLNANASASGLDENGKDMGVITDAFKKIALSLDSAYDVIHHTGKDETKGMRGNSSLYASLDTVIYVKQKHQGSYSWEIDKQREGVTGTKYSYTTEIVETGTDSKGKKVTTLKVISGMPETPDEVREKFAPNSHQKMIWDFLKTYLLPLNNKRANIEDFLEYVHKEWASQNSDQRKSKARKSLDQMKNKGLFGYGTWEDYSTKQLVHDQIWITKKGLDY